MKRVIEARITMRDEYGWIIPNYPHERIHVTCPNDWDDNQVRAKLETITQAITDAFKSS